MYYQWLLLLFIVQSSIAFRQQSVGVIGKLFCGDEPLVGARLKLINYNTIGFNDQLAENKTDSTGSYKLIGGIGSLLSLDARLKIFTTCKTNILNPCQREITLGIPAEYVTRTSDVQKMFNGGVLNMQFEFKDEGTKCL